MKSGRIIKGKKFQYQENCKCKDNCARKIDGRRQEDIFKEFYHFENWSKKTIFLRSLIKSVESKEKVVPIIPLRPKKKWYSYYLNDGNGITYQVCQMFLLKCLQISKATINRAANTIISNPNAVERRGGFRNKDANSNDILFLKAFIEKFPRYNSHYGSSKSKVEYLNPSLNIIKMYREYCLICRASKKKVLTESMFRQIFNTKFNLRFTRPKVDTCKTCDKLTNRLKCCDPTEHDQLQKDKENHHTMVRKYKLIFDETIKNAKHGNDHIEVLTFDLQRVLEMPRLTTSIAYYKRHLCFYNLCIYDEIRQIGYMYVWPESVASRGSQEIAACLCRHFRERLPSNTKKVILYSDSCYGQNRNIKLALMLKKFIDSWPYFDLHSIEQHYFVVGHSYNSCDRCFGLIEKQKKVTENIFVPSHWINVIRQAKKTDPKFVVIQMHKEDFLTSKPLEKIITNRKKTIDGRKISWNKFQNIIYDRNSQFILKFKEFSQSDAPILQISLQKKNTSKKLADINLPLLYSNEREIDKNKYDDLQQLMDYVPTNYHEFFNTLKYVVN